MPAVVTESPAMVNVPLPASVAVAWKSATTVVPFAFQVRRASQSGQVDPPQSM